MSLSIKLQVRQSQSLVMTPQLLQSIRLLQFGHAELAAFVQREAERNPLIEVEAPAAAEAIPSDAGPPDPRTADAVPSSAMPRPPAGQGAVSGRSGRELPQPGELADPSESEPSLTVHAFREIEEILADPAERKLAEALMGELDEAGYLRIDVAEAAERLGCDAARLAAILERLRHEAEPAGLFAADLRQCLALQLARRGRLDPVIDCVLHHLPFLARRDFASLRRLTGEDEAGLIEILEELRRLEPRPGRGFGDGRRDIVVPDVVVSAGAGDAWQVELNQAVLPRVLVNIDYARTVGSQCRTPEDREFLAGCQSAASWLERSLDQRARTILKVAAEIVRRQDGFLRSGIAGLRPLTLSAVAEAVGLHESTVSRVTSNKYVQTPRGTFELKFFFTVAIASSTGGDPHSAASVRDRIRRLIEAEHQGAVLSDDDIAAALKREGIELARRTVAKYREALGLASSVQRRRELSARLLAS